MNKKNEQFAITSAQKLELKPTDIIVFKFKGDKSRPTQGSMTRFKKNLEAIGIDNQFIIVPHDAEVELLETGEVQVKLTGVTKEIHIEGKVVDN